MSELISGKEALIALANGEDVLIKSHHWVDFDDLTKDFSLSVFFMSEYEFKLKPRTIKINGIEVPAPFKPKEGEECWYLTDNLDSGYSSTTHKGSFSYVFNAVWRSENEIKQVITAFRSVFNVK